MIGSGQTLGTHGTVLGIGVITRVGGTHIVAGRMTGTGITATLSIITTTTIALSVTDIIRVMATTTCIATYRIANMQQRIRIVRSSVVTAVTPTLVKFILHVV